MTENGPNSVGITLTTDCGVGSLINFREGESFRRHCEFVKSPHSLEGFVYFYNGVAFMFTQVSYNAFTMIELESGNRYFDPVGGGSTPAKEVLDLLVKTTVGEDFIYKGRIRDIIA
jgi:hypothetical protein